MLNFIIGDLSGWFMLQLKGKMLCGVDENDRAVTKWGMIGNIGRICSQKGADIGRRQVAGQAGRNRAEAAVADSRQLLQAADSRIENQRQKYELQYCLLLMLPDCSIQICKIQKTCPILNC